MNKKEKDGEIVFLPIFVGLGVALGAAFHNIGLGIALGACVGGILDYIKSRK